MLTEFEKRALLLTVTGFAPERSINQTAIRDALDAFGGGDFADLLRKLVRERILTPLQANKLQARFLLLKNNGKKKQPSAKESDLDTDADASIAPTLMALKNNEPMSTPDGEQEVGTSVGEYRLLRKLGQGGMCSVYLGFRESTHQKVAVKILPANMAARREYLDRFYREAKSGAILSHPNIVRNLAFGQDQATGRHYLVMEYVDGPTAHDLLELYRRLSVGDAVHIILDIARGLEHAHSRNIIHRDIKPDNILLTRTGIAKLTDMGLAKRTDEASHLTGTHQGFGTPFYMPYEQAINARHADGRADIYALGATFYHLLTGEVPFPGKSHVEIVEKKSEGVFRPPSAVNPLVPAVFDDIIEKMMAKDPKDRYQTISEVIVALERANLTPALPSFVDEHLAYQDPLVRERMTSSAQPTSPDLRNKSREEMGSRPNDPDMWYLRYRIKDNKWCKAKVTTLQILKRLRERKIPANAEVSRSLQGDFRPLSAISEFQSALLQRKRRKPAPPKPPPVVKDDMAKTEPQLLPVESASAQNRWGVYVGILSALVIFGIVALIAIQLLLS